MKHIVALVFIAVMLQMASTITCSAGTYYLPSNGGCIPCGYFDNNCAICDNINKCT
jgi:hypothetical protein